MALPPPAIDPESTDERPIWRVPNLLAAAALQLGGARRIEVIVHRRLRWVRLDMTGYKAETLGSRLSVAAQLVPEGGGPAAFDDFYGTGTLRALEKNYQQIKGALDGARHVD